MELAPGGFYQLKHRDTKKGPPLTLFNGGPSLCLCVLSDFHNSRTVTEMIHLDVQLAEHCKQQVGHRCVLRIPDVPSAFETAGGASGQHDGKRRVIVLIAVTHCAAVKHHGMVKKSTVAIGRLLQFFEQVCEYADMIVIQHGELIHVLALV